MERLISMPNLASIPPLCPHQICEHKDALIRSLLALLRDVLKQHPTRDEVTSPWYRAVLQQAQGLGYKAEELRR